MQSLFYEYYSTVKKSQRLIMYPISELLRLHLPPTKNRHHLPPQSKSPLDYSRECKQSMHLWMHWICVCKLGHRGTGSLP